MNMIAHDHITSYPQGFLVPAEFKPVQYNVTIACPAEDIDPTDDCKREKMEGCLVPDLVAAGILVGHYKRFKVVRSPNYGCGKGLAINIVLFFKLKFRDVAKGDRIGLR